MPTSTGRLSPLTALPGFTAGRMSASDTMEVKGSTAAPLTMGELLKVCRRLDWPGDAGAFSYEKARRLVQHMGTDTPVTAVTTEYIDQLVVELREGGLRNQVKQKRCVPQANSTIGKYMSALSVLLKRALRKKAISVLPIFPESRTLRQPERRVFTPRWEWINAQVKHLKGHADAADLIRFLADTGCRPDEAFGLTWDRVNLDAKVPHVTFVKTKTRQARVVPVGKDSYSCFDGKSAAEALRERSKRRNIVAGLDSHGPFDHIGRSVGGARYKAFLRYFSHAKALVCNECGLDNETRRLWTAYTIRKARITNWLVTGTSTWAVKHLAGHRSPSTTYAYYADVEALEETILKE